MKTKKTVVTITAVSVMFFLLGGFNSLAQEKWVAPASADEIVNPLKNDANAAESGKKIYKVLCVICHGAKGKGDGAAGAGLTPKPTNLTTAEVQSQTDGAIFWKMEEGRPPMASYKTAVPEKNRWEIINYIRTLKK
jgi:mono/diheme cytochrome c family protein